MDIEEKDLRNYPIIENIGYNESDSFTPIDNNSEDEFDYKENNSKIFLK